MAVLITNKDGNLSGQQTPITISIDTPGLITYTNHQLVDNDTVVLSTTGALPTGLTAGTTYYVLKVTDNTYNVEASIGGGAIATSGTQSGVHTATVQNYYRVEAHNLGCHSLAIWGQLFMPINFPVTFANVGNLAGVGFYVLAGFTETPQNIDTGLTVKLTETKSTCTISVGSPCVVTNAGHGFTGSEEVLFVSTGAIPTGLSQNTSYYVKYIDGDTFNLSATPGGDNINTTGTQSGVHTLWAVRAKCVKTATELFGSMTNKSGSYMTPFTFSSPYAVDTTASKWQFNITEQQGPLAVALQLHTSTWGPTLANLTYFTWSTTKLSFSDGNDSIIVKNYLTIDQSATIEGTAATGSESPYGVGNKYSFVVCSNVSAPSTTTVSYLKWQNPPTASYTLTLKGQIALASYGGFEVGSSLFPIPYAQQAIITSTAAASIAGIYTIGNSTGGHSGANSTILMYGAIPTTRIATIASEAAALQKVIETTVATGWSIGDRVCLGPLDVQGNTTSAYTIANISGTTITLNANLPAKLLTGGVIFNYERHGIKVGSGLAANIMNIYTVSP